MYLSIVLFVLLGNLSCGQSSASKKEPPKPLIAEIRFQSEKIDLGIADGKKNITADFKFSNTGNIPLDIIELKGNCHCVQGTMPGKPIAPGDSSVIHITFDPAGVTGQYQRTLMVRSNAKRDSVELYLTGEIHRDPKEVVKKVH